MPNKAVPYLTVGFGTRPQRLRLPPGMTEPPKAGRPAGVKQPMVRVPPPAAPTTPVTSKEIPVGQAPAGRPPSNLGKYLIKPTHGSNTGYEMLNTQPDALDKVNSLYLRQGQLPLALQPKYLRKPEVLDTARRKSISKGWRKPRSLQG